MVSVPRCRALELLNLAKDELIEPLVLRDLAHLMFLHKRFQPLHLRRPIVHHGPHCCCCCCCCSILLVLMLLFLLLLRPSIRPPSPRRWLSMRRRRARKPIRHAMSMQITPLSALSKRVIIVEERYRRSAERYRVAVCLLSLRILLPGGDTGTRTARRGKIPDGDGELGAQRHGRVLDRQAEPFVPGARRLEGLVGRLCGDGERLAVGP